jgi:hypothetical protein
LGDEGHGSFDDIVQWSVSVLLLIHRLAQGGAGCLELHVLAEIANRSAGDHVSIESEPFDPRPVDRLRMDLHDRHAPSIDPAPVAQPTTTHAKAIQEKLDRLDEVFLFERSIDIETSDNNCSFPTESRSTEIGLLEPA